MDLFCNKSTAVMELQAEDQSEPVQIQEKDVITTFQLLLTPTTTEKTETQCCNTKNSKHGSIVTPLTAALFLNDESSLTIQCLLLMIQYLNLEQRSGIYSSSRLLCYFM